ncbi:hypothetical protein GCM10009123_18090 [Kangiella japonica]|uniref:Uncharacterized protein n=2 Tax=Kangiella japonica TaxID=647384 RepID=A0ABN0T3P7_9GAMM
MPVDDQRVASEDGSVCKKSAPFKTERYVGYSYATGGSCNLWKGRLYNDSNYTIKCDNFIGGVKANSLYALSKEITEVKNIGFMFGDLSFVCAEWELEPYVKSHFLQEGYQLLIKMSQGIHYIALKNTGSEGKHCLITNEHQSLIYDVAVAAGEHSSWLKAPDTDYFTRCSELSL